MKFSLSPQTLCGRVIACTISLALGLSASTDGLAFVGREVGFAVTGFFQVEPDFSESPNSPNYGPNPSRDETLRNGIWDNDTRYVLGDLENQVEAAAAEPVITVPYEAPENTPPSEPDTEAEPRKSRTARLSDDEGFADVSELAASPCRPQVPHLGYTGGGDPMPWESAFPGGGSNSISASVNSNTGNRLTTIPIFTVPGLKGPNVVVALCHNSKTTHLGNIGPKWSLSIDARLTRATPHSPLGTGNIIALRWGNGKAIPFRYDPAKAAWLPPEGFYDRITCDNITHSETYTLTTKHGIQYKFTHPNPGNSFYCGQAVLTKIIDRDNNQMTIAREYASARIASITDAVNRRVSFSYYGTGDGGLLREIADTTPAASGGNRKWTLLYSGGNLSEIKYPTLGGTNYSRLFGYDARNNITSETDLKGKVWTCEYDVNDRQTRYKEPGVTLPGGYNGFTVTYGFSESQQTDPYNRTVVHSYSDGRIADIKDPGGFHEKYSWYASRRVASYTDRRDRTWEYTLDTKGNILTEKSPEGRHAYATYDTDNTKLTTSTDLSGSTLNYVHQNGRLTQVYRMVGGVQETLHQTWYTESVPTSLTVQGDTPQTMSIAYDAFKQAKIVTDPGGSATVVTSPMGLVTSVTNQASAKTELSYDRWNRLILVKHPPINTVSHDIGITYDPEGNITQLKDERGKIHAWTYNDRGLPTNYTNPNGDAENYTYSATRFRMTVQNGRGHTRTYYPNLRDEVLRLDMPDGTKERWAYNGNGDVGEYENGYLSVDSNLIKYDFDGDGRPTLVNYSTGTDTLFAYTNGGHTTTMTDATGTTSWIHDARGNLTNLNTPQGNLGYTYNKIGQRKSMTDSTGTTTYDYDSRGRLKKLTNPHAEVTEWEFDGVGRLKKRILGNGTWEELAYDARSRLTSINLKKPSATLRARSFTYDPASNVLSQVVAGTTTNYEYDDINQLIREYRGPSGTPTWEIAYGYDANGNRIFRNILGGLQETYTNDVGDKLTSVTWTGGSKAFTYDNIGRRKTMTTGSVTTTYAWDRESRLTSVSRPGMTTNNYTYNGLDTRVSKTDSSGTESFRRDGAQVTNPVLSDGGATYTPGVSERRSGISRWLHSGPKNADSRTLVAQTVEATRDYDAFGNLMGSSGTWHGKFGYAGGLGYQEDPDTELKLLGHRYYDSTTGRFLSRDSASDGRNWATYSSNNPVNRHDATGMQARSLTEWERDHVARSIGRLHMAGETTAATRLSEMLKQGKIMIDDSLDKDVSGITAGDTIYLNPNRIPVFSMETRIKLEIRHQDAANMRAWLDGVLLHEWLHENSHRRNNHGNWADTFFGWFGGKRAMERDAWHRQTSYHDRMRRSKDITERERKAHENAFDKAKEELEVTNGGKYGG